jgi:hypothetical protein
MRYVIYQEYTDAQMRAMDQISKEFIGSPLYGLPYELHELYEQGYITQVIAGLNQGVQYSYIIDVNKPT